MQRRDPRDPPAAGASPAASPSSLLALRRRRHAQLEWEARGLQLYKKARLDHRRRRSSGSEEHRRRSVSKAAGAALSRPVPRSEPRGRPISPVRSAGWGTPRSASAAAALVPADANDGDLEDVRVNPFDDDDDVDDEVFPAVDTTSGSGFRTADYGGPASFPSKAKPPPTAVSTSSPRTAARGGDLRRAVLGPRVAAADASSSSSVARRLKFDPATPRWSDAKSAAPPPRLKAGDEDGSGADHDNNSSPWESVLGVDRDVDAFPREVWRRFFRWDSRRAGATGALLVLLAALIHRQPAVHPQTLPAAVTAAASANALGSWSYPGSGGLWLPLPFRSAVTGWEEGETLSDGVSGGGRSSAPLGVSAAPAGTSSYYATVFARSVSSRRRTAEPAAASAVPAAAEGPLAFWWWPGWTEKWDTLPRVALSSDAPTVLGTKEDPCGNDIR